MRKKNNRDIFCGRTGRRRLPYDGLQINAVEASMSSALLAGSAISVTNLGQEVEKVTIESGIEDGGVMLKQEWNSINTEGF